MGVNSDISHQYRGRPEDLKTWSTRNSVQCWKRTGPTGPTGQLPLLFFICSVLSASCSWPASWLAERPLRCPGGRGQALVERWGRRSPALHQRTTWTVRRERTLKDCGEKRRKQVMKCFPRRRFVAVLLELTFDSYHDTIIEVFSCQRGWHLLDNRGSRFHLQVLLLAQDNVPIFGFNDILYRGNKYLFFLKFCLLLVFYTLARELF